VRKLSLLGAIVVGLVSLVVLHQYKERVVLEASGGPPVAVVVAASSIAIGDVIEEGAIAIRELPQSAVEARHIKASEVEQVLGVRVVRSLRPQESILWGDLAIHAKERQLSGLVKQGMRAVGVHLEQNFGLSELVRPGDRIDLLMRHDQGGQTTVHSVLQNVLVLAVGADIGQANESEGAAMSMYNASALTVSLTTQQAQILTLASGQGSLSAVLRHPDDIVVQDVPVVRSSQLLRTERRNASQQVLGEPLVSGRRGEIEHVR
jgi:pilus assembly protein CpaB